MNVVELKEPDLFRVQVGLLNGGQGFRARLDWNSVRRINGTEYMYFVKCRPNETYITVKYDNDIIEDDNVGDNTLIFNITQNCLGIMDYTEMVEPVDMLVTVERKK